jgi:hypothetical protein
MVQEKTIFKAEYGARQSAVCIHYGTWPEVPEYKGSLDFLVRP